MSSTYHEARSPDLTASTSAERTYRIARNVLFAVVLVNAFAAGLRAVSDPDMGWHLATGRWVLQHLAIPSTDVLSYTAAGAPWIYPPFAGVLLYLIYTASGYAGLSVFCAVACAGTVAYLTRCRDLASLALAMLAIEPIALRTGPRADLFTTVFLAISLGELWAYWRGESKRLWLLPAILLLWVNLHPGFLVGFAVLVAYVFLEVCELPFSGRRGEALLRLRKAWPWLAGSVLVTFINPWGPKLISSALGLAGIGQSGQGAFESSAAIQELRPFPLSIHLLTKLIDLRDAQNGLIWLMAIAVIVIVLALWRKQPGPALLQAAALALVLQRYRYIALFAVVTTIIGTTVLADAFSAARERLSVRGADRNAWSYNSWLHRPELASIFASVIGAIALLHTVDYVSNRYHVVSHTHTRFGAGEASWFPERAVGLIRREKLPPNVYEDYELGGFGAWRLGPEYPDFMDGRVVTNEQMALSFLLSSRPPDSPEWRQVADRWGINVLLIGQGAGRAMAELNALKFCQSAQWRPIYMDEVSLVLLRNTPANRPWLDRLEIDCLTQPLVPPRSASRKELYDFWWDAGGLLFALQRIPEAEAALLRAAELYPQDPTSRGLLGIVYESQGMYTKAESEYRASLALGEEPATWRSLGRLYRTQQRFAEAAKAYSRAASLEVSPSPIYLDLARVQLQLRRPKEALKALERCVETSPYRNAEAQEPRYYAEIADARSDAHAMLSELGKAIRYQQESLQLNPSIAVRWNKLAALLATAGRLQEAQQAQWRAQQLQSNPVP